MSEFLQGFIAGLLVGGIYVLYVWLEDRKSAAPKQEEPSK